MDVELNILMEMLEIAVDMSLCECDGKLYWGWVCGKSECLAYHRAEAVRRVVVGKVK